MRRVADMHPGQAKTDARDAYIIDTARTMPHTAAGHRSRRSDCRSADAVWVYRQSRCSTAPSAQPATGAVATDPPITRPGAGATTGSSTVIDLLVNTPPLLRHNALTVGMSKPGSRNSHPGWRSDSPTTSFISFC